MSNKCDECGQDKPSSKTISCKRCGGIGRVFKIKDKNWTDPNKNDLKISLLEYVKDESEIPKIEDKRISISLYKIGLCRRCNGNLNEYSNDQRRNSKNGKAFERKIAVPLKEWWNAVDPNCDFQRTPASGGSALKVGWGLAGDLCTNSPSFPLHVECKRQAKWELHDILVGKKGGLAEYADQSIHDAISGKIPSVIFTHPGGSKPVFIMCLFTNNKKYLEYIRLFGEYGVQRQTFIYKGMNAFIAHLDSFLKIPATRINSIKDDNV